MQRASFTFESIAKDLGLWEGLKLDRVKKRWSEIFPPPLSLHMQPYILKNRQLFIQVDSQVWMQELHFYKKEMLSKLKIFNINSIKLRLGNIKSTQDNNHKKTIIKPLNSKDASFIIDITDDIHDEILKISIKKAMEQSLMQTQRVSHK